MKRINCTYDWPRHVCTTSRIIPQADQPQISEHECCHSLFYNRLSHPNYVPIRCTDSATSEVLAESPGDLCKATPSFSFESTMWLTNSGLQLLTCLAAAISLLFMWIAIKARQNTTHIPKDDGTNGPVPGTEVVSYNAAASACLGVWFFFWLWLYNT